MTELLAIQTVGTLAEGAGGPTRTVSSLCAALVRTDISVELVAGWHRHAGPCIAPQSNALVVREVEAVRRFGITRYPQFGAAVAAACAAHPGALALVHDNGIWGGSNVAAIGAAQRLGLPYVISPHGMLEPWALAYHAGRKKIAWWAYQRRVLAGSAALVATADAERSGIRRLFPKLPVAVIANGIDAPDTAPATDPASRTVLFMSRLHPVKNLIGLIDAWAIVCARPEHDGWRLEIAGPDEAGHRADVERQIERRGLGARVALIGAIADADKAAVFARSALFVLPSFSENFGVVAGEALAAGLPVIATHGTPWHELGAQHCGWWVAPEPAALADALAAAISVGAGERRAMGVRGHGWVRSAFGWPRIAAATAALYRWVLTGGVVPDFVDA